MRRHGSPRCRTRCSQQKHEENVAPSCSSKLHLTEYYALASQLAYRVHSEAKDVEEDPPGAVECTRASPKPAASTERVGPGASVAATYLETRGRQ